MKAQLLSIKDVAKHYGPIIKGVARDGKVTIIDLAKVLSSPALNTVVLGDTSLSSLTGLGISLSLIDRTPACSLLEQTQRPPFIATLYVSKTPRWLVSPKGEFLPRYFPLPSSLMALVSYNTPAMHHDALFLHGAFAPNMDRPAFVYEEALRQNSAILSHFTDSMAHHSLSQSALQLICNDLYNHIYVPLERAAKNWDTTFPLEEHPIIQEAYEDHLRAIEGTKALYLPKNASDQRALKNHMPYNTTFTPAEGESTPQYPTRPDPFLADLQPTGRSTASMLYIPPYVEHAPFIAPERYHSIPILPQISEISQHTGVDLRRPEFGPRNKGMELRIPITPSSLSMGVTELASSLYPEAVPSSSIEEPEFGSDLMTHILSQMGMCSHPNLLDEAEPDSKLRRVLLDVDLLPLYRDLCHLCTKHAISEPMAEKIAESILAYTQLAYASPAGQTPLCRVTQLRTHASTLLNGGSPQEKLDPNLDVHLNLYTMDLGHSLTPLKESMRSAAKIYSSLVYAVHLMFAPSIVETLHYSMGQYHSRAHTP